MVGNSGSVGIGICLSGITKGSFCTGHSESLKSTGSGGLGSSCLRGWVVIGTFVFASTGIGSVLSEFGGLGNSSGRISGVVSLGLSGTFSGFLCSPFNGHISGSFSPVFCLMPLVVILHSFKVCCDSFSNTVFTSVSIDFISVHSMS